MKFSTLQQAIWLAYQQLDWHNNVQAHALFCNYYGVYFRASPERR